MIRRDFIKSLWVAAGFVAFGGLEPSGNAAAAAATTAADPLSMPISRGDVFTIEGLFSTNPVTRLSTPYLQQFVVTGMVGSDVTICPRLGGVETMPTVTAAKGRLGPPWRRIHTEGWRA